MEKIKGEKIMKIITDEEKKNFVEWSEGNKYLYDLLCACWENEIPTNASCGGHEKGEGNPYLSIIINDNSIEFMKSILGQIQDMENIEISANVRHSGDGQLYDDDTLRSVIFYAKKHNCCEMFYKMKKGIECKDKSEKLNSKAERFLSRVKRLKETSREELQEDINNNMAVGSTFSTKTQEFTEYENSKKLTKSNKITRFFRKLLSFRKIDYGKIDLLNQKYGFLQKEYTDVNLERNKFLEQYRVEIQNNKETNKPDIARQKEQGIENKQEDIEGEER